MINREEFEDGLKKLGYKTSEKKMAHILEELDANKDGNVEFHEFLRPTCKKHKEEAALEKGAGADKAFELLDGNVDGKVTAEEFHAAISKVKAAEGLTLEDIKGFIDQYADTDGDQELSYDEVETLEMTHT
mmetsp:Transcript_18244/g.39633  ORF Transcript_18244/g.39633 Transcript_18244/m.39633 type:complete len:131 (-) Transcript_18244:30-422(-)